jgi:hypothetical protein
MPPHHRQPHLKLRASYVDFCVRDHQKNHSSRNGTTSSREDEGKPHEPTHYLPGTTQKINLMSVRAALGLPIFLPGDVRLGVNIA